MKEATVQDQGVRAALLQIGESEIELLEPIDPNGGVAKFLERRGEGLHHVCFATDDVEAKKEQYFLIQRKLAEALPAIPVLIGLGVKELSVTVPTIPAIKAAIGRLSLSECQALADEVLALGTAEQVRARLAPFAE